ncbi:universal stress protein [Nitrosomonas marina]|uniref:Nucleotide-binding universal stress protein, UspA family n=1 Tax=Nitrosomonas marina TaxID=917 RepID=A0A1H8IG18_9PROT|nr:universal stress protein [Nitrosomonas marina]SEN67311.1 Nucleotide-binding universal stress protein, UspA family [Nitrosomonas marina]
MKLFNNLLYVFEQSIAQDTAIARAVSLAQNNQARLTIIDVIPEQTAKIGIPPGGPASADLTAAMIAQRRQMLKSLIAPYTKHLDFGIEILVGIKFLEVIRAVLRNDYDLVIKLAENPDWVERLFGSDDMHLLRKCPCPIWLMKPKEKPNYERIVAAVDFDPYEIESDEQALNQLILGMASSLALSDFAQLHLVHVWDAPEAGFVSLWADNPKAAEMSMVEATHAQHKAGMDTLIRMISEQISAEAYKYLTPRVHLLMGSAQKAIPALVKELKADLVVMGTVARTGIPGFIIGNTAEAILDQLQCSVLAVKPPGFVSPVPREP